MISVSNDFKTAVAQASKTFRGYLVREGVYYEEITDENDLNTLKITAETSLLKTIMRQLDATYRDDHYNLSDHINPGIGVVLADTSVEYIDYGSFRIVELTKNMASDITTIQAYDKMYESIIAYDLDPIYERTFPCTVLELLQAICTRLDWTLKTDTFPNSTATVGADEFTGVVDTYRQVLEMIAEVAGSIIYFDVDDELVVKQISHDSPLEELDADILLTLKIEEQYGEINSVVLSRHPQEDNIVEKDDDSIAANGLTEIKIRNNWIVDDDRETYITPIFNELFGLWFYPFKVTTNGLGYIQVGDRLTVTDPGDNEREVVPFKVIIDMTGGIKETLEAGIPEKDSTNYYTAGIIGQTIKNTEIKVDKQEGTITLLNSDVDDLVSTITQLEQTVDDIQVTIYNVGGNNLLKNSVGLKGAIDEYQDLDEDGDPVDARNDGTIVTSTEVQQNGSSGSGIQIDNQFIYQTFPTIVGEEYTFYVRFKRTGTCTVTLAGQEYDMTTEGYIADTWDTFKQKIVAGSASTTLRIENTGIDTCLMTDLNVQLGDANGWIQAPNEVYGANYKFGKDGLEISSLTDTFKTLIDNSRLVVIDTSGGGEKEIMSVSKDEAKINNLTVQKLLTLQREGTTAKSTKMISTSNGSMLVIND